MSRGAGAWHLGHLTLDLTVNSDDTVYVASVQPVIFRRYDTAPAWGFMVEGGCGDAYGRIFDLDLDKPRPYLQDEGVKGETGESPQSPPPPFGKTFTVSKTEPARIMINARACTASVEWGLVVTYFVGTEQHALTIGKAQEPYKSMAGPAPTYVDGIFEGTWNGKLQATSQDARRICQAPTTSGTPDT